MCRLLGGFKGGGLLAEAAVLAGPWRGRPVDSSCAARLFAGYARLRRGVR